MYEVEEFYYLCSENKGAEQLHCDSAADCTVTAQLICTFVFTYAKTRFSHDAAHIINCSRRHCLSMIWNSNLMSRFATKSGTETFIWVRDDFENLSSTYVSG